MTHIADELNQTTEAAAARLRAVSDKDATVKPAPDRWSKKEVVGHLIDSAANNHQRFVRAQQSSQLVSPLYGQEEWVRIQDYQSAPWQDLIEFWRLYNLHLASVIRRIPADKLEILCKIGDKQPVPLGNVVESYITHMKHHLGKIGVL